MATLVEPFPCHSMFREKMLVFLDNNPDQYKENPWDLDIGTVDKAQAIEYQESARELSQQESLLPAFLGDSKRYPWDRALYMCACMVCAGKGGQGPGSRVVICTTTGANR